MSFRIRFFTGPKSAIDLRDADGRGGEGLPRQNQLLKQRPALVPIPKRVNEHRGVKQDELTGNSLHHRGLRCSSRPSSRVLGSLRNDSTHAAVPIFARSG